MSPEGGVDAHALERIELPRVLERVARHATSPAGRRHVLTLRPRRDPEAARRALAAADQMAGLLLADEAWAPGPIPELAGALRELGARASVLEPEPLRDVGVLLATGRRARRALRAGADRDDRPLLLELSERLPRFPELEERLGRAIDEGGKVTDGASPELGRLRRDLRARRSELVGRLEAYAGDLPERHRVPDFSVTVRAGRYCIPVRREGRSAVGGIVHDESASRQTLFVEPPLAIEPMNRIRELEMEEAREVRRVLAELTDALRPHAEALREGHRALMTLDGLFARARWALAHGGHRPALGGDDGARYRVREGHHPLLLAAEEPSVPFDLTLERGECVLLVSGPNAGGKTVLLKAVGLLSALAQAGVVPPVGPGTRLPVFRRFFALIGDEQSIDASLSTFSAQVAGLRTILEEADADSLVLLDEVGSHTDPAEGAALAAAILSRLAERGGLTVATTHLGALKALAGEDEAGRVVNASLQFDAEALRPTYRLRRDRPGRSYALEIAARLGLPEEVLAEARDRVGREGRALESVLEELERREAELEALAREARARARSLEERSGRLEEREAGLEARAEELGRREAKEEGRARERAERYLLEARRTVEEAIARLEERYASAADEGPGAEEAAARARREEAASEARAAVERAVRRSRERAPAEESAASPGTAPAEFAEGETVRIRSLDRTGRVDEVRGDRAVVQAGGVRLTLPAEELERAEEGAEASDGSGAEAPPPTPEARPELEPRPEVDLRGLRVDEVAGALLPALDAAIVGDLPRLRVIHGKGTGALRERVAELLREEARVSDFRPGSPAEGGYGVTVVQLQEGEGP